ncbi:hypothetical protein O6H91_13G089200 [Diphasiastrum complanatum]|uniref:Uncharacterized protein n=1 Tax=Diphasiastrum complanatum TaxID=34168 RepID=A0ACC2BX14_DIPCM|nr:hypothetical protein O6H91_13G089200 [Diphasiastrum complanatum]
METNQAPPYCPSISWILCFSLKVLALLACPQGKYFWPCSGDLAAKDFFSRCCPELARPANFFRAAGPRKFALQHDPGAKCFCHWSMKALHAGVQGFMLQGQKKFALGARCQGKFFGPAAVPRARIPCMPACKVFVLQGPKICSQN